MVDDAQRHLLFANGIGVESQVHRPYGVDGHRAWSPVAHLFAQARQGVLIRLEAVGYKGLANGATRQRGMLVIEIVSNLAATLAPHQHFEPQHFLDDPVGFAPGGVSQLPLDRFRDCAPREAAGFGYSVKPAAPPIQDQPPQP